MSKQQTSIGQWFVAGAVICAVIATGAILWHKATQGNTAEPPSSASAPAPAASAAPPSAPVIQHPIAQAGPAAASSAPLPALDASDGSVADALAGLAGGGDLRALLLPEQIISRIVATVDVLPKKSLGSTRILPVRTPKGPFVTEQKNGAIVIGDRNTERYAPYMRIVEGVDPKALVAWYVRDYPLFQDAYRELGYPKGYFNDRLVTAIDNMLAAPDLEQPAALTPSRAFYVYADPSLESLSVGQKLLLRVGPANEALIKAKLRAIRADLTGQVLPATAGAKP
jgi:hypothetical protein